MKDNSVNDREALQWAKTVFFMGVAFTVFGLSMLYNETRLESGVVPWRFWLWTAILILGLLPTVWSVRRMSRLLRGIDGGGEVSKRRKLVLATMFVMGGIVLGALVWILPRSQHWIAVVVMFVLFAITLLIPRVFRTRRAERD